MAFLKKSPRRNASASSSIATLGGGVSSVESSSFEPDVRGGGGGGGGGGASGRAPPRFASRPGGSAGGPTSVDSRIPLRPVASSSPRARVSRDPRVSGASRYLGALSLSLASVSGSANDSARFEPPPVRSDPKKLASSSFSVGAGLRLPVASPNGSATPNRLHTMGAGAQSTLARAATIGAFRRAARSADSADSLARASASAASRAARAPARSAAVVSPGFKGAAPREKPPPPPVSPPPSPPPPPPGSPRPALANVLESASRMRDRSPSATPRTSTPRSPGSRAFTFAAVCVVVVVGSGVSPSARPRSSASRGLALRPPNQSLRSASRASAPSAHLAASPAPAASSALDRARRHS